ncbi:hypothetical protein KW797_03260 [Candidatus Parcubacteria bacterium]|nr:hypothetical protein [Candidatus Parcubacteria bacterium]
MTPEELAKGRELLQACTPGEWRQGLYEDTNKWSLMPEAKKEQLAKVETGIIHAGDIAVAHAFFPTDRQLIIWLRNHAGELLAAAAVEAEKPKIDDESDEPYIYRGG